MERSRSGTSLSCLFSAPDLAGKDIAGDCFLMRSMNEFGLDR